MILFNPISRWWLWVASALPDSNAQAVERFAVVFELDVCYFGELSSKDQKPVPRARRHIVILTTYGHRPNRQLFASEVNRDFK
jgi:hypothetical protein